MIGRAQLAVITRAIEATNGQPRCWGDLVLAIQRILYGSEAASLSPEEHAEVVRYFQTRGSASGSLRALAAQRRDDRI